MRTVLLGVSTRSLSASAAAAGHRVAAADFFGDRDQEQVAESYALGRDLGLPLTARGLATAARRLGAQEVVYGANLENHPEVVDALARDAAVLGNPAEVLREVRDWRSLRAFCRQARIAHPRTLLAGEEGAAGLGGRWLTKRVRSGGGHGVRRRRTRQLGDRHLLQAELDGRSASAAFVADGERSRLLAVTEQLVGRRPFGARGFAWCGSLLPFEAGAGRDADLFREVERMAALLTQRYGLRGVNGLDLVVVTGDDGRPWPHLVELNPRYSASMELVDIALEPNVYELHLGGVEGRLPAPASPDGRLRLRPAGGVTGKAVVFARRPVTVPDTDGWYERCRRDIPRRGQRIAAGHPVCTVLGRGRDRETCLHDLTVRAEAVYGELENGREDLRGSGIHADHRAHA